MFSELAPPYDTEEFEECLAAGQDIHDTNKVSETKIKSNFECSY